MSTWTEQQQILMEKKIPFFKEIVELSDIKIDSLWNEALNFYQTNHTTPKYISAVSLMFQSADEFDILAFQSRGFKWKDHYVSFFEFIEVGSPNAITRQAIDEGILQGAHILELKYLKSVIEERTQQGMGVNLAEMLHLLDAIDSEFARRKIVQEVNELKSNPTVNALPSYPSIKL